MHSKVVGSRGINGNRVTQPSHHGSRAGTLIPSASTLNRPTMTKLADIKELKELNIDGSEDMSSIKLRDVKVRMNEQLVARNHWGYSSVQYAYIVWGCATS